MPRLLILAAVAAALELAAFPVCAAPAAPRPAAPSATTLEAEIARLAEPAQGVVGVAAWRLDGKGPRVLVRGAERFPMASAYKVGVAGAVLAKVEAGQLALDQMVAVPMDMMVPSEVIADRFIHPGLSVSIHNLLELMLTQSDNTATDVLVKTVGGPQAVTAWLRAQGIEDQRFDRDTATLLRDFFSLPPGPLEAAYDAAIAKDPTVAEKGDKPNPAYDDDPRDTSTPEAMGVLLTRIFNGQALNAANTKVLTEIMARCRTGENRLRARLPAGTLVADKTGTLGGTVNDVGVITLPDGSRIVVVVFIKKSRVPFPAREKVIAEIGRAAYDHFLFQAPR